MNEHKLPFEGIRVLEFTHMVMGPSCGMILADLGAEVIKVEPLQGDSTRHLLGSGMGFFPTFNRNKKSIAIDTHTEQGRGIVRRLVATVDVFSENFKNGTMAKLGLDYESLKKINEKLIYVSHKGFLPGPYEHRTALDEVVQMMGGLAYMTGPEGRPLRAGASVNDIMGGMFGAIGVMAALRARENTGKGQEVLSALYENNVFLMASHMMQFAMSGKPALPMPSRISAWGIYDVFTVANGEQIFLAVVSNTQWAIFCERFHFQDLAQDARLETNNKRVSAREWMMPLLRERLSSWSTAELGDVFEVAGLPYSPIREPHELFDDTHLKTTHGLAEMDLPDGRHVSTPLLPIMLGGVRPSVRTGPPKLGGDTDAVLASIGLTPDEIAHAHAAGVVG